MKKNTIFLISLLVLTACASTAPQGARVRPVDGQPQPAFSTDGSATAYALQDMPSPQSPQSNEVGFLGNQTPQNPNGGNPVFPANSANDTWPNTNNTLPNTPANAAPQGYPTEAPTAPVAQAPTTPAPAAGGNAVKVLLDDARKAVQENRLDKAASSLERAVRLEPRNASIWYDLAQIRLHQKNYAAAEQMANKSISFTKNEDLIKRNRQIITAAQTARSAGN
ncbi:tetratricopeptide repeat protein [Ignatzschineria sp. LJL83]